MSCALPELNMDGWSVLDFELALIGARALFDSASFLVNQPRASRSDHSYRPGAFFIVEFSETTIADLITRIVDRIAEVRFDEPEDEERRINLWLSYWTSHGSSGEPLDDVLAQVAAWRAERS